MTLKINRINHKNNENQPKSEETTVKAIYNEFEANKFGCNFCGCFSNFKNTDNPIIKVHCCKTHFHQICLEKCLLEQDHCPGC